MNFGQNTTSTAAQQQIAQQQLASADANTNNAKQRLQTYQQAEQTLVNNVAWLPIEQETQAFLRNPAIVGIVDNAQNIIPPNDWANIYRVQ
jgi:peptide/nickel transport system substrate-binding protein/oligopeptide transport system substrate-binding protein